MKCYAFIARFQIIVLGYLGDKGVGQKMVMGTGLNG